MKDYVRVERTREGFPFPIYRANGASRHHHYVGIPYLVGEPNLVEVWVVHNGDVLPQGSCYQVVDLLDGKHRVCIMNIGAFLRPSLFCFGTNRAKVVAAMKIRLQGRKPTPTTSKGEL